MRQSGRPAVRAGLVLGAGLAAARWAPSLAVPFPSTAHWFGLRSRIPEARGVVLTFDDGPHPEGTPAMLAALERWSVQAVFFVSGEAVGRDPALAREVVAAGHELGVHGHRHQSRRQLTRGLVERDTRKALAVVTGATGVVPRLYRPPHGTFSVAGVRCVRRLGLEPLLWSRWGKDWRRRARPESVACDTAERITRGDVVLLHDSDAYGAEGSWRTTVAALPLVLAAIAEAGLAVVLPPELPFRERGRADACGGRVRPATRRADSRAGGQRPRPRR